jgi:hypothetical protein
VQEEEAALNIKKVTAREGKCKNARATCSEKKHFPAYKTCLGNYLWSFNSRAKRHMQHAQEQEDDVSSRSVSLFFSMITPAAMEDEYDDENGNWDDRDGTSSCYSLPTSTAASSVVSKNVRRSSKKQKIRTADASSSIFSSTSTTSEAQQQQRKSLCCTSIVDPRSFAALQCFRLPQASNNPSNASEPGPERQMSEARLKAVANVISTREKFVAKKICITRAVFMGLLHRGAHDPHFFVRVHRDDAIAAADSNNEFKDGTLFTILCIEKVCVAVLRAWSLLNTDPGTINKQLQATLDYLRTKRCPGIDVSSSTCEHEKNAAWTNFKQSVREAQILPLELLALRVMRSSDCGVIPDAMQKYLKDAAALQKRKRLNSDWHTHQHWFMSHMVEYESSDACIFSSSSRSTRTIKIKSYKDWPTTITSEAEEGERTAAENVGEDEEDTNNDIRNDQWQNVCRKRYDTNSSSGGLSTRKLTKNEMKVKAKAGPFHPMLVGAVNKAIEEACLFCEF